MKSLTLILRCASLLSVFGLGLLLNQNNGFPQSNDIPGFPISLKWKMTKKQIESVIASNGLNLAYSNSKTLEPSPFAYGKSYTWAVIKEEHLRYFGKRRFIMLRLDKNDRLVAISMKLLPSGVAHNSAHANEMLEKAGQRVKENTCGMYSKKNDFFSTQGCVWKISDTTWLEMQMEIWEPAGRRRKSKMITYVNLHWFKP